MPAGAFKGRNSGNEIIFNNKLPINYEIREKSSNLSFIRNFIKIFIRRENYY